MDIKDFTAPYGQEEFLYFVLSTPFSVESVVNRVSPNRRVDIFSSEALSNWTIANWYWAVDGIAVASEHITVTYAHNRILNSEHEPSGIYSMAHFHKRLPIYQYYQEVQSLYQPL